MERRPLLLSLRARLIASHWFVILLALGLVLVISAVYLRRYEGAVERERIEQLSRAVTVSTNFNFLNRVTGIARNQRIEAIDAEADELEVRLLVFDRAATVLYDSDERGDLAGTTLDHYLTPVRTVLRRAEARADVQQLWVEPSETGDPLAGELVLLSAGGPRASKTVVGLVAPPRRYPLLARFLPRLLIVVGGSLAVASLAGYALSRRIAAPVARLTEAANGMAAGKLEQRVSGEGPDELGRLVESFNTMSRQVAATARSQRDLLANVAHELRTPLTSVQGYAQALRDGVIGDEGERTQALATIGRESERMTGLIGQLLDLARLESGQATLKTRSVAVAALLARVAERFQPAAAAKGVTLDTKAGHELFVVGDESRLIQVFSNLVDNAIRHTPHGGHVKVEATPGVDGRIRLTVADTGEGIDPERLPRIFERFARGERDGGDRTGFGLGLAIVRELVELHGGSIGVASRVGVGTTFVVELPSGSGLPRSQSVTNSDVNRG